jgi:hypothetical protein
VQKPGTIIITMRILVCLFAAVLLGASGTLPQQSPTARYQTPPARNDGWQTANADSVGIDSVRLAALTQSIRSWPELGVHAILIERNGRLIYEEYFDGFDERWGDSIGRVTMTADSKHDLRSITKSVVSALIGIAHGEGKIQSLDQPLIKWFPECAELDTPERRRVTAPARIVDDVRLRVERRHTLQRLSRRATHWAVESCSSTLYRRSRPAFTPAVQAREFVRVNENSLADNFAWREFAIESKLPPC